ncbi:(-)-delta-cadinene synthase (plasmid) [Streptomyces sp. YIM 121038]|uniref:terpene synthase family protein n=1 Tax=Streptomyces sp. YIM 121038 TaxID=2136401 RepID=UPI001162A80B|nr:terpene synthase family protein [Streptomyces sp. YIM 121038]QCX82370.1 (-)-delta-cadinene synthase [Streptomyces sp. YIM 121038]
MFEQHRQEVITLPFQIRRHQSESVIQRSAERWATHHGLLAGASALARFRRHQITGLMTAGCDRAGIEDAALVVEFATLAFFLDDQQNNAARTRRASAYDDLNTRLRAVISGSDVDAEDSPLVRALSDILEHLEPRARPDWHTRFRHDLALVLNGHEEENAFRRNASIPDIGSFSMMRREASFCYPIFDMLELCRGAPVSSAVHNSSPYQVIREAIADIMCWTNDVHSLHMELAADEPINFVTVLQHAGTLTTAQAVQEVCERIDNRVKDFIAARHELSGLLTKFSTPNRVQNLVLDCVSGFESWAGRMEEWDRTGTNRFDPSTISASGLPSYVEDLLPR